MHSAQNWYMYDNNDIVLMTTMGLNYSELFGQKSKSAETKYIIIIISVMSGHLLSTICAYCFMFENVNFCR